MADALTKTECTALRYTFEKQNVGGRKYMLVVRQWLDDTLIHEHRFYDLTADNVRELRNISLL